MTDTCTESTNGCTPKTWNKSCRPILRYGQLHQAKAENVLLTMIPETYFTQTVYRFPVLWECITNVTWHTCTTCMCTFQCILMWLLVMREDYIKFRWYWTPNAKIACFELSLKIINTFMKNRFFPFIVNCPRNWNNALEFFKVGQTVLELLIKTLFWLFWSIN